MKQKRKTKKKVEVLEAKSEAQDNPDNSYQNSRDSLPAKIFRRGGEPKPVENLIEIITPNTADLLRAQGITETALVLKLKEELDAHEQKVFCDRFGDIHYSDPLISWPTRVRARHDGMKLLSMYPAEKIEVDLDFSDKLKEALSRSASRRRQIEEKEEENG